MSDKPKTSTRKTTAKTTGTRKPSTRKSASAKAAEAAPVEAPKVAVADAPAPAAASAPAGEPTIRDLVTIVFRTHLWDETVNFCVETFEKYTDAEIIVAVDETRGEIAVPERFRKIPHTVDSFAPLGLPMLPSRDDLMWYSGDYVMYQIVDEIKTPYVFIMEGDSTAVGPVDDMLMAMIRDGVEYSPRKIFDQPNNTDRLGRYFEAINPGAKRVTGPFPSIFAKVDVIRTLFAERKRMAETVTNPQNWVYCEHFAATAALQGGYKVVPFGKYSDITLHGWRNPVRPQVVADADDSKARFFHPVLPSPKWEAKRIEHLEAELKLARKFIDRFKKELAEARKPKVT